jgi:hypothetical protein
VGAEGPKAAWAGWTKWSRCSANPCKKGETQARSRQCLNRSAGFAGASVRNSNLESMFWLVSVSVRVRCKCVSV